MPNRLQHETSPYLLQHANNPVDWYPWGVEAFGRAQEEDKPILLSIGYAACHWCHVMEHESFEDESIAGLMNTHFINIKVDREERPDLDSVYMQAVQAMTGRGGWPMTVFLTPDGKPFYAGTYFPPQDQHGMPGFPRVLEAMTETYRTKRHELEHIAEEICDRLEQVARPPVKTNDEPSEKTLHEAFGAIHTQFDDQWGGFNGAPKFPQAMAFEFLLRYHLREKDSRALKMVEQTLKHMANGGIFDQAGGGFHRYSTDKRWLVPHFEKMLYDNGLLAKLYLNAYQVTGNSLFRHVTEKTLDYLLREMQSSEGGFYSSQDADTNGVEGDTYLWTLDDLQGILTEQDSNLLARYYNVTQNGNFEGQNILHVPEDIEIIAVEAGLSSKDIECRVEKANAILLKARLSRPQPGLDDKILTSWNALVLRALAEAGTALNRDDFLVNAVRNASFLLDHLRVNNRLHHSYRNGIVKVPAYLEDYAFLADALISLHEATFDFSWLREAQNLVDIMITQFWDDQDGVFYDTSTEHEKLLVRPREFLDTAIPCGSSVATQVLLRIGTLLGRNDYREKALIMLKGITPLVGRFAAGFGQWLCALDFALATPQEIVIIGSPANKATQALRATVHRQYLPNKVLTGAPDVDLVDDMPLLKDKSLVGGRPTAYVCHHFTCELPATDPKTLACQLGC
jgi:uncharacterized protein YyaL (SSP411 family)